MEQVLSRKIWKVYSNKALPKEGKGEHNYIIILNYKKNKILKIGTAKSIKNRLYELLAIYEVDIIICWISPPYSKYTTLRAEDKNREVYKNNANWEWIKLDRFRIPNDVTNIIFTVRKDYVIPIIRMDS